MFRRIIDGFNKLFRPTHVQRLQALQEAKDELTRAGVRSTPTSRHNSITVAGDSHARIVEAFQKASGQPHSIPTIARSAKRRVMPKQQQEAKKPNKNIPQAGRRYSLSQSEIKADERQKQMEEINKRTVAARGKKALKPLNERKTEKERVLQPDQIQVLVVEDGFTKRPKR